MGKMSVVVIDDHEVVRRGLKAHLEAEVNLEVIGEAADGFEGLQKVRTLKPDLVVADLQLPASNGLDTIRQIHKENPNTKIIVYSFYDDESTVLSALHAGAMAYLVKSSGMSEFNEAIASIVLGRRFLGSPLPELAIDAFINMRSVAPKDPYALLTNREKEILQLVAERNSNSQIAERLVISRRTVEIHRSHIMKKLGLHRPQVDLVRYAAERGMIKPLFYVESSK